MTLSTFIGTPAAGQSFKIQPPTAHLEMCYACKRESDKVLSVFYKIIWICFRFMTMDYVVRKISMK